MHYLRETVGLTATEKEEIASWLGGQAGKALWRVGGRQGYVVQGVLSPAEKELFFTNNRMGG